MSHLFQDLRFAVRTLLRNRGFTATAITALALGIGATSAVFSVVYGVLLKPLPYKDPARLVRVYENNAPERFEKFPLSPADFLDYRKQNRVFDNIATYVRQDHQFGGARPERLIGVRVSHGFFQLFGAEPALGRAFTQQEEANPGVVDVAILSYRAWQRLLGGNPHAIGTTIRLDDYPFRLIGVMPRGFENISGGYQLPHGEAVDLWLPLNMLGRPQGVPRAFHYCNTVARLRPGVTIQQAQADMNVIAARLDREYVDDKNWRIQLKPLQDDLVGSARSTLLILAGAVAFVLLIACVNVANLLLARATARQREMAIRVAVGASRARLVSQMLTESVALAAVGGALGLLLAWCAVRALVALGPEQVPRLQSIDLDARVVLATVCISLICGILFGLAPARASTGLHRSPRPHGAFVVAEVALTFVLLIGAGLLLRTFVALGRVDPGFSARGVLTINTSLSYPKLTGARRYAAFYERFVESLQKLPGVTAAGSSSELPWTGAVDNAIFGIEGRPRPADVSMHAYYQYVSPDYLRAIGVPLLAGRWLTTADHFDAPKVVLVNRTLALQYWPAVTACLGQRIYTFASGAKADAAMTIVGVVGDVKDSPTAAQAQAILYEPFLQSPSFGNYMAVRANIDMSSLIPEVKEAARRMGDDLTVQEIRPLEQVVAASYATQRFALQTIGLFAAVALLLSLIGIYGVMSYATARRTQEIAIRSALGATRAHTLRLLLAHGARLVLPGLAVGAAGAAVLTRAIRGLLFQVSPIDPLTFAAVAAILAAVAIAACFGPARKALAIDPVRALRHE